MALGSDLPPAYHTLKEEATTEQNATVETIPVIPYSHDVPETYGSSFEDKDSRIGFIQKVLTIKMLQVLLVTMFMVIFVAGGYGVYRMMSYRYGDARVHFIVISTLALVATEGLIHYCDEARFTKPFNYMFLVAYPLSIGFFTSVVSYGWGLNEIFTAWVQFNLVVFALLLYSVWAFQTKIDFKTSIGLYIAASILIVTYALSVPFIYVNAFGVLYTSLMMFLLSAYLLSDIQAMTSSDYHIHLTPADFVKAALIMHIDYRYMIMKLYKKHAQPHFSSERNADPTENVL